LVPSRLNVQNARFLLTGWLMVLAGAITHAQVHSPCLIQMTKYARAQFMIPTIRALMELTISLLVNRTGQVVKLVMLAIIAYTEVLRIEHSHAREVSTARQILHFPSPTQI
jgi:hypothetical protein